MTTEILRRQDDLSSKALRCENLCDAPLQPLDLFGFAFSCGACGELVFDRNRFGAITKDAGFTVELALAELDAALETARPIPDKNDEDLKILARIRRARTMLANDAITAFGDTVHAMAIDAAARMCARRAESQYQDSKNPIAGTEAAKCAFAVQRLRRRSTIADRPELASPSSLETPEAGHA